MLKKHEKRERRGRYRETVEKILYIVEENITPLCCFPIVHLPLPLFLLSVDLRWEWTARQLPMVRQCQPQMPTTDANHAYLNTTFIRRPCTLNYYSSHRHLSRPVSPMRYLQCLTLYFNGKSELSSRMQTMWNHKFQFVSFWSIESDRQQQCCT